MGATHRRPHRLHGADHRAADDVHPVRAAGTTHVPVDGRPAGSLLA